MRTFKRDLKRLRPAKSGPPSLRPDDTTILPHEETWDNRPVMWDAGLYVSLRVLYGVIRRAKNEEERGLSGFSTYSTYSTSIFYKKEKDVFSVFYILRVVCRVKSGSIIRRTRRIRRE